MTKTLTVSTKTLTVAKIGIAAGAILGLAFGTGAWAQTAPTPEKPITIKLGAFFPTGSRLKNGAGDTWFSAGAEYAVPSGASQTLSPLLYLDYAGSNRHGVNADYVGVGPGVRYYLTPPGASTLTPYVGAGIGAYFLHASGFGSSSNKTQFGYRLNAGVEFSGSYLAEISYTDPSSLSGTRFSGFNLQVGARF